MNDDQSQTPDTADERPRRKKARIFGLGAVWLLNAGLAILVAAVLLAGGLVLYLKNNAVTPPAWAERMIEDRLAEVLPQVRVSFGEMAFLMDDGWTPRMQLRDVAVLTPTGGEIVRFNEVQATFAASPMMDGQIQPRRVALSGIVARLKRGADGRVSLRAGAELAPEREAATLPQLIGQVDQVLQSPALAELREVDLRALTLRYEDATSGRAWTVDGGRLRLDRDDEALTIGADLAVLGGGAGVSTLAANYTSQIGETAAEFGITFDDVAAQDIAAQGPAFAWLGVLQALISGSVRSGLRPDGRFEPLAATLQIGAGSVQPNAGTQPIPFQEARSYFSYDPRERLLTFDELSVRSQWIAGQATGTATLAIDEGTGQLDNLVAQISVQNLAANPNDLYDSTVLVSGVEADFRLALDPFRVTLGRALIEDQGQTLLVNGELIGDPMGWRVAFDGRMDAIDPARLLELWPQRAAPNTRKWLDENLKAGDVRNIDVALRRGPDRAPQTYLAFDYDAATVRFSKTLPPVTDGKGHFSLADNRMVVALDAGAVVPPQGGAISVTGSSFIIPDVRAKPFTPAVVRLETRSNIEAALSLLNMPPLSVMDKAKLPVELGEGRAAISATLALALEPGTPPKVDYHATGDLLGVKSDVLVKDRSLAAERLQLDVDNTRLSLQGAGTLDGVPFDAVMNQPLGKNAPPGEVSADLQVTPDALETFGIVLPPGSISGQGQAQMDLTLARGAPPSFDLTSNLQGIGVSVPQVNWSKPARQAGELRVSGTLGADLAIDRLELSGPGLSAQGEVRFAAGPTLERVRFQEVDVGNWFSAPLDLIGQGKGKPLQVVLRGGTLDLRRAEFGTSTGTPGAPPMQVALDRLQITDTIALTNMRGRFDTAGGLDGSFEALLNGEAPVQGRVVPQNGRSAVRIISADAGRVLRSAGLLRQVKGGDLQLLLLPVGSGGAFDGRLTAQGVTIRDAPGIAALLNSISVVGLVNELNGDGIYFDSVEASFRLTPDQLTLTAASAVGASMGLSMDGTYALASQQLDMQGVISPVYLLNGIGSLLTRRGEGLIGFNYALAGDAKSPRVSVNPLSALTPAMFREIFREPPPELPEVDGVTESVIPQARPAAPTRPVARRPEGR